MPLGAATGGALTWSTTGLSAVAANDFAAARGGRSGDSGTSCGTMMPAMIGGLIRFSRCGILSGTSTDAISTAPITPTCATNEMISAFMHDWTPHSLQGSVTVSCALRHAGAARSKS
jgi:hypothetical protein